MKSRTIFLGVAVAIPLALIAMIVIQRGHQWENKTVNGVLSRFELPQELESANAGSNELAIIREYGPKGIEVLENSLKAQDPKERLKAVWLLGRIGPEASNAIPALIQAIDSSDPGVRYLAIRSLTSLGANSEQLVPKLVVKLADASPMVCAASGELLNGIEAERRARNLPPAFANEADYALAFLKSPSVRIQLMGVDRLPTLRQRNGLVMAALKQMTTNQSQFVKQRANSMLAYQTSLPK